MNQRLLFILFLISVVVPWTTFAQTLTDEQATRLLLGRWTATSKPGLIEAGFLFKSDGTFSSEANFVRADEHLKIKVIGKWQVKDGILIEELTYSSNPNMIPPGLVTRDTLISVNEHEYKFRTEKGAEAVRLREYNEKKFSK